MDDVMICVHGAGGGAWEFDLWKDNLAEIADIRIIAVHLSPAVGEDYETTTLKTYVDQILQEIATVDRTKSRLWIAGASMGGTLIAKAYDLIDAESEPNGLIFVCTTIPTIPLEDKDSVEDSFASHTSLFTSNESSKQIYPLRVCWAGGSVQETIDAIPDATLETCEKAALLWRDESGTVLNAIASGVKCTRLKYSAIPKCVVIPMADTSILPQQQLEFALSISATIFQYDDMSHVGPLLGTRCTEVVEDLAKWIKVTATTHC